MVMNSARPLGMPEQESDAVLMTGTHYVSIESYSLLKRSYHYVQA